MTQGHIFKNYVFLPVPRQAVTQDLLKRRINWARYWHRAIWDWYMVAVKAV
jgi:hypothetical protein